MKRRNFLAFIPSLGALPFISDKIVKEQNSILLLEPKPIEVVEDLSSIQIDPSKLRFLMEYEGMIIGTAHDREMVYEEPYYELENLSYPVATRGPELIVRARFREEHVMDIIHAYRQARVRNGGKV